MKHYEQLMYIIACGVNKRKPLLVDEEFDFELIFKLAKEQGISALVYTFLEGIEIPLQIAEKWNRNKLGTIQKCIVLDNEWNKLISFTQEHNIPILVYKGIVLRDYYPLSYLRLMGDIDIHASKESLDAISEYFLKNNFQKISDYGDQASYFKPPHINMEIHRELFSHDVDPYAPIFSDLDKITTPLHSSLSVKTFNPTYHFMYIVIHLIKHMTHGGAGIRNIIDIFYFYQKHSSEIDFDLLKTELESRNAYVVYQNIMKFTCRALNTDYPFDRMNDKLYTQFLEFIMENQLYGGDGAKVTEIKRAFRKQSRLSFVLRSLFPSYKRMKALYPSLKTRFLLIFYWIYHIFARLIFRPKIWKKHTKVLVEKNTYDKTTTFFEEIGIAQIERNESNV